MANMNINPPVIDRSITAFPCSFDKNKDILRAYFYFQSLGTDNPLNINTSVVFAKLQLGGKSVFNGSNNLTWEPFAVWADTENLFTDGRFYIEIPANMVGKNGFEPNSVLNLQLKAVSQNITNIINENLEPKDFFSEIQNRVWNRKYPLSDKLLNNIPPEYQSKWSTPVFFQPIAQPIFVTYGGLTQDQISAKEMLIEDVKEETRLYEETYIESEERMEKKENPLNIANKYYFKSELSFDEEEGKEIETDCLVSYTVQLLGLLSATNSKDIISKINEESTIVGTGYATNVELESSNGQIYIDTYWDPDRKSFYYGLNYDFLDEEYSSYELIITYTTRKGYKAMHSYTLVPKEASGEEEQTDTRYLEDLVLSNLTATPDPNKGAISLSVKITNAQTESPWQDTGILVFERAVDKSGSENKILTWETCYQTSWTLDLAPGASQTYSYDDITVEPGTLYKYRVKFKNWKDNIQSYEYAINAGDTEDSRKFSETGTIILFIEDIFLSTRDLSLRVRYNPDLSGYKRNVSDIVTPTLGGSYPFVRRNGAQKYRTFNIGGLISYNSDLYDPIDVPTIDSYHPKPPDAQIPYEFQGSLFIKQNGSHSIDTVYYNQLEKSGVITKEQKRIIYEKLFRDMVMDFLYDDQVILFKSQPEGNIFIRLSNVALIPDKQLDRHIYSFSATATEVLEANNANYLEYFSTDYNDNEETSFQSVYLLSAMYTYDNGTLYIGAIDEEGLEDVDGEIFDMSNENNDFITAPITWNQLGVTFDDEYNNTTFDVHTAEINVESQKEV